MNYLALLIPILFLSACSSTNSGAIEFNTTSYYINGKFTKDIPDSLIRKQYGFILQDDMNGTQHAYKEPIKHRNGTVTKYCSVHMGWENIRHLYLVTLQGHGYIVSRHKRF